MSQGPPATSNTVEWSKSPEPRFTAVFIYKFRTKTGSWQGLIGCRGFLVFTDWPVIIPLIGQSYHPSDWPSDIEEDLYYQSGRKRR